MITMKERIKIVIGVAFFAVLFFEGYCFAHGWYMDNFRNRLHEDCVFCRVYRLQCHDNAAFAIREAERKGGEE